MSTSLGVLNSSHNIRKETLLHRIGGDEVLHKAVDDFYARVMRDKELGVFFHGANIQILKWHNYNIMSVAFSKVPDDFDVEKLIREKHVRLFDQGLSEHHFDIVIGLFVETLKDLNVDQEYIDEAVAEVAPLRLVFEQGAADAKARKRSKMLRQSLHAATVIALVAFGVHRLVSKRRRAMA